MEMPKPSDADKERFRDLVPQAPSVEIKPMFGNLAGFVNGNMFMGLFGSSIGLKLDDDDRQELFAVEGAGPFGPEERPMGSYVALPPDWTDDQAEPWIDKALTFVGAQPPKKKKSAKKKAAKKKAN